MGFVDYDTSSKPDHLSGAHADSRSSSNSEISTGNVGTQSGAHASSRAPVNSEVSAGNVSTRGRVRSQHVTQLLIEWQRGDKLALDQLMPLVYRELRKVAAGYLNGERLDHTLQPTALSHESYVRMVEQDMPEWESRAHFFGVASRLMRQILVDYARSRRAAKRGGDNVRVPFEEVHAVCVESERILTLDAALNKLSELDERKTRIVEMRLFGGMTISDIAIALEVSEPTINRDLRIVKAWLRMELGN